MKLSKSPFRIERRLTPELFDHYLARARDERARAISAFGQQVIAAASRIAARLIRHRPTTVPLDRADLLTR